MMSRRLWLCIPTLALLILAATAQPIAAQASQWEQIAPGGETTCLRNAPYSFFHRADDPSRLLIYLLGGGACWDVATCTTFAVDQIAPLPDTPLPGIFDFDNPANPLVDPASPLANASIVAVAYCSGDLHGGDRENAYTDGERRVRVQHRGAINAGAALAFAYERYPTLSELLIAGSSAGGYGALIHAESILTHYDAQIADGTLNARVFADASPGIYPTAWNPSDYWGDYDALDTAGLIASRPNIPVGYYSNAADFVSTYAYTLQGGTLTEYDGRIADAARELAAAHPNFSAYIASGVDHTILPLNTYYTLQVGESAFAAWFGAWLNGESVSDVFCEGC
jgi:hypothetical protein